MELSGWMGEIFFIIIIFFFQFFAAFQAWHRGRVSFPTPPTPSPRRGLAAASVPVVPAVPGPGAAFGNGRTHTGAVAGSGGSRLANYSPGEPLRTWAPGTRGCNRPPCASPSPLPGLCCWAGRLLVGSCSVQYGLGGMRGCLCTCSMGRDGEGEPPSHPKERVWHSGVSPWWSRTGTCWIPVIGAAQPRVPA